MKKKVNYIIFIYVFSFFFLNICNAECSYKERTDLLNKAKNVEIVYEVEEEETEEKIVNSFGEEVSLKITNYIFKFTIANLDKDIYISYLDSENNEQFISYNNMYNGIFTFQDRNYKKLFTYEFIFHTYNQNCLGNKIYTKKVVKPVYNGFSEYEICQRENMENYKYCKKFLTEEVRYSDSEILDKATKYYESLNVEEENSFNIIEFFKDNFIYFLIGLFIVISITLFIVIRKKRSSL